MEKAVASAEARVRSEAQAARGEPVAWQRLVEMPDRRGKLWIDVGEPYARRYRSMGFEIRELFASAPNDRAEIERLRAAIRSLTDAFEPLVAACEEDMAGPVCDDCSDDESVAEGVDKDGYPTHASVTFGHIRRARAALASAPAQGGDEQ